MSVSWRRVASVGLALTALSFVACGSEEDRPLTAIEASRLVDVLDEVRERTAAGDAQGAREALREVRARLEGLEREGALTETERRALDGGLTRVARSLEGRPRRPARKKAAKTTKVRTKPRREDRDEESPARTPAQRDRGAASSPPLGAEHDEDDEDDDEGSDGDD